MRINTTLISCYCFSIYIFISELTLPFKFFFDSSLSVWIISAIVFLISAIINLNKFMNVKIFFTLLFFLFFFTLNAFLSDNASLVFDIYFEFAKFIIIPMLMFLVINDYNILFKSLTKTSFICFFILLMFFNQVSQRGDAGFINYMEYGNSLAQCFIFIAIPLLCTKVSSSYKYLSLITLTVILLTIFFYGNRGAFLSLIIFLFFGYFFRLSLSFHKKMIISILSVLIIIAINFYWNEIINSLYNLSNFMGITSYSISKLKMATDSGIVSSVGERGEIALLSIALIIDNYGLPGGVTYFSNATGMNYPHNLLLDISLNFGVFITIALLIYTFTILFLLKKNTTNFPLILIFVFSFSVLMFSQSFWFYTLFWIFPSYHFLKEKKSTIKAL
ncbi:hypothetical protein [Proteus terrae]|uniref:hypothetical protein n=2 Tax=Proteus terrae TaxID=1574161 RepID=UPI001F373E1F|nr:hypothetical protein [Proteus terrae]